MVITTVSRIGAWVARWGFAVLVGLDLALAFWAGFTVRVPVGPPSFALQALPVYRLEVGAAVFVAGYVATLALVLALNNSAFSEIGTSGVKAHVIGSGPEWGEQFDAYVQTVGRTERSLRRKKKPDDSTQRYYPNDDDK